MERAIVKFNNGNLAVLCSYCHKILKTGADLTNDELFLVLSENEKDFIPAQYCETCKPKENGTTNNTPS
jgi:hypothetical protein